MWRAFHIFCQVFQCFTSFRLGSVSNFTNSILKLGGIIKVWVMIHIKNGVSRLTMVERLIYCGVFPLNRPPNSFIFFISSSICKNNQNKIWGRVLYNYPLDKNMSWKFFLQKFTKNSHMPRGTKLAPSLILLQRISKNDSSRIIKLTIYVQVTL